MKKLSLVLPLLCIALSFVNAQNVTFTFGSNSGGGESQAALDGLATGSVTVNSLTLTATANSGTFNSTSAAGFGINASPSTTDSTTEFDETDVMSFSFDKPVTFNSIDLNVFGGSDTGFLTYSGGTIQITSDPFAFNNVNLAANEVATFGNNTGASFSLQSFNVTVVPEPATWILMGVGLLLGTQRLRRKV
jgi:PEP-CTERM motif